MSDMNQCNFTGRLGKDVEARFMPDGRAVANFSIAVKETWKDRNTGQKQERTEWVNLVFFGPVAEICHKYLSKGSKIRVTGKQRTRKWEATDGTDRYTTEIVVNELEMLGDPKGNGGTHDSHDAPRSAPATGGTASRSAPPSFSRGVAEDDPPPDFDDSDIPF
jgi:single-strand DNA-binding protein